MNRFCKNRLSFELLERRDLLAVVRLVAWNTMNGPNDAIADANFSTVLAAIGNETVAGNTERVSILALQETDPPGSGAGSIIRIENILDSLYPSTDYASVVSMTDGGGDSTGFVYDTSSVTLIDSIEVAPGALTHTTLRGRFRPVDTFGESDFFAYSIHLKSGDSNADEAIRTVETSLIRNDADALGEGTPILIVGDLNLQDSFGPDYANLTASGAGQVQDIVAAPGNWSDNIAFRRLHTQNPQASIDDRFDLQLASGEFFDGVGIEYVDNSYRVFGNDGSHGLGGPITTGTGASPSVLNALFNASDHLPVVVDYEVLATVPAVRIRETGSSTNVVEGGLFDTYNVVLGTVPTANVTVTISPDIQVDLGITTELVFTPANALTPQTIVVNAFDDMTGEGIHGGFITHSVVSADTDYDGLAVASVEVFIVDDDDPTIVINELDSDTQGIDTLEFVELYDGGVGNTSLTGKTVAFFNGTTDTAYATFDLNGQTTNSEGFFVLGNAAISVADLIFSNNRLQNGPDAVALFDGPFASGTSVTTDNLIDAVVYDTNDADDLGLLILLEAGQPQLNENENGNKDFDSLSRLPDHGEQRQTVTFAAGLPTPGQRNDPPAAGILILQSGARVDVMEGGMIDSYQIALDTIPNNPVTITVDPDQQTDLGAGPGVAILLSFTVANALIPQTIDVMAIDDADIEGDHISVITHAASSIDSAYNGLLFGNVVANVFDNESPIVPSIVISEILYNPDSDESEPGIAEWIEVVNTGSTSISLRDWRFDDEDGSSWGLIPEGTLLAPNQAAVFFDEEFTDANTFRAEWSVPTSALVIGVAWGSLNNSPSDTNEILELLDDLDVQQDLVNFEDANPWPSDNPDGASIYLTDLLADNNEGSNWLRSAPGLDDASSPVGTLFSSADIGSPGYIPDSADFDGDGDVDGADFLAWQRGFGTPTALKSDGDADNDSDTDAGDLLIWEGAFGAVAPTGAVASASFALSASIIDSGEGTLAAAANFALLGTSATSLGSLSLGSLSRSNVEEPFVVKPSNTESEVVIDQAFARFAVSALNFSGYERSIESLATLLEQEEDEDRDTSVLVAAAKWHRFE